MGCRIFPILDFLKRPRYEWYLTSEWDNYDRLLNRVVIVLRNEKDRIVWEGKHSNEIVSAKLDYEVIST